MTVKLDIAKDFALERPVLETWDMIDVYLYMSVNGSFEICQGCKPSGFPTVVRFGVPKIETKPELISSNK